MCCQVIDDAGEFDLSVSGLQATAHGGLDTTLRLGVAHLLREEIGVAAEVVCRCECDRVDTVLDLEQPGGRESRDSLGERPNERSESGRGQRSIDPAVP